MKSRLIVLVLLCASAVNADWYSDQRRNDALDQMAFSQQMAAGEARIAEYDRHKDAQATIAAIKGEQEPEAAPLPNGCRFVRLVDSADKPYVTPTGEDLAKNSILPIVHEVFVRVCPTDSNYVGKHRTPLAEAFVH